MANLSCLGKDCRRQPQPKLLPNDLPQLESKPLLGVRLNILTTGPKAKAALTTLLAQFDHRSPWVRVSCQAAVGSMGKEAVPALIETFENNTGGPRVRAAFVLGGIGPDAKPAVPVILRIMKDESPVIQERFAGVLRQIDPERFDVMSTPNDRKGGSVRRRRRPIDDRNGQQGLAAVPRPGARLDLPGGRLAAGVAGARSQAALDPGGPRPRVFDRFDSPGNDLHHGRSRSWEAEEAQFVIAFDLRTRKELWATRVGPPHTRTADRDARQPSTATVSTPSERTGTWSAWTPTRDTFAGGGTSSRTFEGQFMSVWKFSESPLVDGDRLICTPGGPEATMVALDKHSGNVIWKCAIPELGEKGADGAGYSSAVVAEICGVRQYVQMVGRGVIGVEAATGRFLWGYNRIANNMSPTLPSPAVRGNYVFATTAYNTGSVLLKIGRSSEAFRADEVYFIHSARIFRTTTAGSFSWATTSTAAMDRTAATRPASNWQPATVVWKAAGAGERLGIRSLRRRPPDLSLRPRQRCC